MLAEHQRNLSHLKKIPLTTPVIQHFLVSTTNRGIAKSARGDTLTLNTEVVNLKKALLILKLTANVMHICLGKKKIFLKDKYPPFVQFFSLFGLKLASKDSKNGMSC